MSDGEFKKDDELEKLSLDSEKEDSSSLDEYGVWIKGSSDTAGKTDGLSDGADESLELSSESLSTEEGEVQAFDFDGLSDEVSVSEDDSSIENIQSNSQDSDSKDSSFDDIDMSDFFTDLDCDENMESDEKEDEESISMDLNFDTVDSYAEQDNKDDFDAMLDDLNVENASSDNNNALSSDTSEEDEINDLLSDLNSSPSTVIESNDDQVSPDIELNINVDEVQDFAKLADDGEDASISLSFPSTDHCEQIEKTKENDSEIVVKNTVIDPENMDDIIEKNRQALGEDVSENVDKEKKIETDGSVSCNTESFNDVEALAKELTEDSPTVSNNTTHLIANSGVISVAGLDKVTDLLQDMTQELISIKEEIASLRSSIASSNASAKDVEFGQIKSFEETHEDESGFFKDEDTDEAIALTGDELNNILITADFTEEKADEIQDENEKLTNSDAEEELTEESVANLESSHDDEISLDEENDFEDEEDDPLNFDDITLENSKLDDFVIPEELDYNMLNSENVDNADEELPDKAEGTDMSYLDEKDSLSSVEDENQGMPESQEVPVSSNTSDSVQGNEDNSSLSSGEDELPANIKKDIKSVLSYMDQLLESLPEDKMKEFAESEYFEMYNRLFNELGIS